VLSVGVVVWRVSLAPPQLSTSASVARGVSTSASIVCIAVCCVDRGGCYSVLQATFVLVSLSVRVFPVRLHSLNKRSKNESLMLAS